MRHPHNAWFSCGEASSCSLHYLFPQVQRGAIGGHSVETSQTPSDQNKTISFQSFSLINQWNHGWRSKYLLGLWLCGTGTLWTIKGVLIRINGEQVQVSVSTSQRGREHVLIPPASGSLPSCSLSSGPLFTDTVLSTDLNSAPKPLLVLSLESTAPLREVFEVLVDLTLSPLWLYPQQPPFSHQLQVSWALQFLGHVS